MDNNGRRHSATHNPATSGRRRQFRKRATTDVGLDLKIQDLVLSNDTSLFANEPPLMSSYNDKIRPLLDAVDNLRQLKVMEEGIQLPTIVVVGDQSSGKSSVLESLAGISLPRGQGICTRVPLIMRLQHHPDPDPEYRLVFLDKDFKVNKSLPISSVIVWATNKIAGDGKGISDTPLTVVVKKKGVPDLTMVDLPGITRVPVQGQPENIYQQISDIIMKYIKPEESIILNVLSATADFPTCESISMSQSVNKTGNRTLAVVTKSDKAPEGLLEKVIADDVNIGLGYVCVRNCIGDETYEEARVEEAKLFEFHPLLSKIDKSMVGIPVLAQKLVQIQAKIISKCLPDIVKKINDKLNSYVLEQSKLPQNFTCVSEAMSTFMSIVGSLKESLKKILLTGEYNEFPQDKSMHCGARLAEMLNQYAQELSKSSETNLAETKFLDDEIKVLEDSKGISLPNFLSRTAFRNLLQRKIEQVSEIPLSFVEKVWDYIETVVMKVLSYHSENYPQLHCSMRTATQNLIAKMKDKSTHRVMEMVEMEKLSDYTCDPDYMTVWNKLMESHKSFVLATIPSGGGRFMHKNEGIEEYVNVHHLKGYSNITRDQAFDMKMRLTSYWKIVLKRLVDYIALQLRLNIENLANKEIEKEIMTEVLGSEGGGDGAGIKRMMEESPSVALKREKLNKSIRVLRESKQVVAKIMDKVAINALN